MDFSHFPCASCQEQVGFKRKHPGLCQANVGWVLWMLSSYFMTRKSCAQLLHFLDQLIIQRSDLVHNVALEQNQNKYLTQCSPGKLLVHVSEKALRTPTVYQLFHVWLFGYLFVGTIVPSFHIKCVAWSWEHGVLAKLTALVHFSFSELT